MINNYFQRFEQYLLHKEIFLIIKQNKSKYSVKEIAKKMKPFKDNSLENKLPVKSAKTLRLILEN